MSNVFHLPISCILLTVILAFHLGIHSNRVNAVFEVLLNFYWHFPEDFFVFMMIFVSMFIKDMGMISLEHFCLALVSGLH